jgi:transposase, IS5 family
MKSMRGNSVNAYQQSFLYPNLLDQLDPRNALLKLAAQIPWTYFEETFLGLYSHTGRPSKAIRLMVGLCILKHVENLSDEVLIERWVQNPYYQAFCGEVEFQWKIPCDPTDLVYFRKRIGSEGFEKILAVSIAIHGEGIKEKEACIDTTVQEKNITFPTDDKLHRKVIERCWKLADEHQISLRRSYRREMKKILLNLRFRHHPKNFKKAKKASKRLQTIAGTLLRELERKLPFWVLEEESKNFKLYHQVIHQKKGDKNKIYSLHEPHVYCVSKGKVHKRYEFGVKASIAKTKKSNLIVGAMAFAKNMYDGHTLSAVLEQVKRVAKWIPDTGLCDRGYRGEKKVGDTQILIPQSEPRRTQSAYQRLLQRKRFRKRAGIEGVISHLKLDHRLGRNFLPGFLGDEINVLMAAAAYNFRKWLLKFFGLYFLTAIDDELIWLRA